ncbi:MAG: fluoride efflux transporter FluC [Phycisphaerales bacterium JB063]
MWKTLVGIAIAGAVGTLARYGLSTLIDRRFEHNFYGTLAANALGCLLFGLVLAWVLARVSTDANHPVRLILLTGFMGAFTTFSTYAYLSHDLIGRQQWGAALGHILAHNVLGIGLFVAGLALGSKLA